MTAKRKALALISGGLDSMLAARVIQDQGIHVEGVNFYTGFCVEGHTHAIRNKDQHRPKQNNALWVAEKLNMRLHIEDVIEEYKEVLTNPRYGYGANLNPCLDCKIFMVRKAREWIEANGFDFIITGEVVGQRPKSQKKKLLPIISDESEAEDRLLRPLSAKLLEPSLPEREGWVDRDQLFDFHGRSRKPQMALARQLGMQEWAQPAGGCCFLTDEKYSAKLSDLWRSRGAKNYDMEDIMMLKVGRHLRPRERFKLIIARDEGETNYLKGYRDRFTSFQTVSHSGPIALLDGHIEEGDINLAARIVARFSSGRSEAQVELETAAPDGSTERLTVAPLPADQVPDHWYIGGKA
ncbi:tRNA (5-methylaminomethyl-2-thiouridylate)-methyltransferase [Halorhodospira halochloris]|uniref:tRNA (5-methylaminomethyl-2-thiouridylate)-methyltransferase n=1 Tax=Halorhodospira halochloris TaxID=1052 RepID=A0A110B4E7_HALHR|nr:tRNA (5-methylaminomethyl-2-thiouridylate)-methyltransferase [Halorhodospira halochloris]MBK1650823.1 tRNA (5-methylaminomethyl-2-thiouridylate)-methyltransferase [Halorhodospira halochloris]MCG5547177.1 tRNA (5-methylaminomethyl-2-thiouridylate)-methyltransferase [Halorhodospira halochloris]BAU56678.1 tRNA (5-methylaminomethyl-2-thiouridylate)-methyltransferase [Halorhodospira halochloris]